MLSVEDRCAIFSCSPSASTHLDVVRQVDGSYTAFEVTNADAPVTVRSTPHFERVFAECLPHVLPAQPKTAAGPVNALGVESQKQVSMPLAGGGLFVASTLSGALTFTVYDGSHQVLSQRTFQSSIPQGPFELNDGFLECLMADVNGDGNLDLVALFNTNRLSVNGAYIGGVWVFFGDGTGRFDAGRRQEVARRPVSNPADSMVAGDLNGDGKVDLLVSNTSYEDSSPTVAFGNGDGTFTTQKIQSTPYDALKGRSILADVNGDGKLDWIRQAYGGPTAGVAVGLGRGDGTFGEGVVYAVRGGTTWLAAGDVTGDGAVDLVTGSGAILPGDGKGGFGGSIGITVDTPGPVTLLDVDGDGVLDIAFGDGNGALWSGGALTVAFGLGKGDFLAGKQAVEANEVRTVADFDGDGKLDIATLTTPLQPTTAPAVLKVFKGDGRGRFTLTRTTNVPFVFDERLLVMTSADLNRDGKIDVAIQSYGLYTPEKIRVLLGDGDGGFREPWQLTLPTVGDNRLQTFDANQDGIPDLLVSGTGFASVWIGKGNGTFPVISYITDGNAGAAPLVRANRAAQLATANSTFRSLIIRVADANGYFLYAKDIALPSVPTGVVGGDFTGDGRPDAYVSGDVPTMAINQDTTYLAVTSSGPYDPVPVDVNGDGILDLVGSSNPAAGVAVALGHGDGTFDPQLAITTASQIRPLLGDFDGDGLPDLLTSDGSLRLNGSGKPDLRIVSAASFRVEPLAPGSIGTIFGKGFLLGPGVPASGTPLPTSLGGVTVTVEDAAGVARPAALFYAGESQVNFVVPKESALGLATITLKSATGMTLMGRTSLIRTTTTLFTAGDGWAAANAVRVSPDGTQTAVPVIAIKDGQVVPVPIDVRGPGQVFLQLFGTGFDVRTDYPTAKVRGDTVNVTYSGPQGSFTGLDQVNILLDPNSQRAGKVEVTVTIDGRTSNPVFIAIQ